MNVFRQNYCVTSTEIKLRFRPLFIAEIAFDYGIISLGFFGGV